MRQVAAGAQHDSNVGARPADLFQDFEHRAVRLERKRQENRVDALLLHDGADPVEVADAAGDVGDGVPGGGMIEDRVERTAVARPGIEWGEAEPLLTHEWIVTNGLGGYASGTVAGVSTRRYHGLLGSALPGPTGNFVSWPGERATWANRCESRSPC